MIEFSEVATFVLLVALELVLGIDNILLISILTNKLPAAERNKARYLGLGLAFGIRLLCLLGAAWLQTLTTPLAFGLTGRDMILLSGGLFLIYKAVREMHHVVEHPDQALGITTTQVVTATFGAVIVQIVLLDVVFSIDSVITAVGLTNNLYIIYAAVLVSFAAVLAVAPTISSFVHKHPSLKVLALSFLICIGTTLILEAMHVEVPKGYIYLPMGFALGVELLQMRLDSKRKELGA